MTDNYITNAHSDNNENIKVVKTVNIEEETGNIIKNFVIKWGRKIVDIMSWLGVIFAFLVLCAIIISYFVCLYIGKTYYYYDNNYICICGTAFGLLLFLPLIILIITILSNYFLYLIIDIRDSLKEIKNK